MNILKEEIDTFSKWVTPARIQAARSTYGDPLKLTQEAQLAILGDAADGNTIAADYLFDQYRRIISKAFWKYYMGPDKHYYQSRISAGDDVDFASMAYEMLLGGGEPSPYDTFKASKFTDKANLLKQFGYYLYRYLQNEAIKMIRASKMGGMTGNVKQQNAKNNAEKVSTVGYEDHFENNEEASATDSFTDDVELEETVKAFLKYLKGGSKPIYHEVFLARLKGLSIEDTAAKLGISGQSVRNHLKAIKELYDTFTGGR